MKRVFKSSNIRLLSLVIALILAIPGLWEGYQGFFLWLSPFIMLNSVFALKNFVLLNFLAVPVLILVFIKRRWFCRYLCPSGLCFDKVSSLSKNQNDKYTGFPYIGLWLAVISLITALFGLPLFVILDPLAIFSGFFTAFSAEHNIAFIFSLLFFPLLLLLHLFLPGIWCSKICPLGGMQTVFWDIKTHLLRLFMKKGSEISATNSGRRYFIKAGAGLIAGLTLPRSMKKSDEDVIRPPGTVEPVLFNSLCCRCGSCQKACPTGIIIPYTGSGNLLSFMTPVVKFGPGYCLESCNICSRVCPTGAITLFEVDAKSRLIMGIPQIILQDCYLSNNRECIKCRESCRYKAIEFIPGKNILNMIPVVDPGKCVGCGACEVVCPAECIVTLAVHRYDF